MRLNPPTVFIFIISLILAGLGIINTLGLLEIPYQIPKQDFWLVVAGYVTLVLGNLVRGL